ncbi:MAG: MlaD family protein [Chitinophagales bacterium]
MKISNESKVGILAAVAIALLFFGITFLKGQNIFKKGTDYVIEYDNASGLQAGDPVLVDGLNIGKVKSVNLQDDKSGVRTVINLEEDLDIPDDSYAMIRGNIMGEKYVQLFIGNSNNILPAGSLMRGSIEQGLADAISEEFKPISDKVKSMVTSLDTAINIIRGIFTDEVVADFQTSIENIKNTLVSFNESAQQVNALISKEEKNIDNIITDVSGITGYVKQSESNVKSILNNLKVISDSLQEIDWTGLSETLQTSLDNLNAISAKIDSGQGSLGLLVNDQQLYNDLTASLQKMDSLLTNFSEDPTIRLVLFGGKKKQAPE